MNRFLTQTTATRLNHKGGFTGVFGISQHTSLKALTCVWKCACLFTITANMMMRCYRSLIPAGLMWCSSTPSTGLHVTYDLVCSCRRSGSVNSSVLTLTCASGTSGGLNAPFLKMPPQSQNITVFLVSKSNCKILSDSSLHHICTYGFITRDCCKCVCHL